MLCFPTQIKKLKIIFFMRDSYKCSIFKEIRKIKLKAAWLGEEMSRCQGTDNNNVVIE